MKDKQNETKRERKTKEEGRQMEMGGEEHLTLNRVPSTTSRIMIRNKEGLFSVHSAKACLNVTHKLHQFYKRKKRF